MGSLYKRKQKMRDGTVRELPTWWLKYYQNGRAVRESAGTSKETKARRMLRAREGDVEHGIPVNPKMGRITFDEAATDLLNDYQTNARTTYEKTKRRVKKHLTPVFGGRLLAAITTSDLRAFVVDRQKAGASNGEINRELAAVKRMFSLALDARHVAMKPKFPMLAENNVRRGFFDREKFEAVRGYLPEAVRPVVTFAYLTGWRLTSEILPLEWRQVDWKGAVVRLDPGTTKNREGRSFPLTAELRTLLETQQKAHEKLKKAGRVVRAVFHRDGEPIKDFRKAWRTACEAAGVPGRLLHDFRRTAVRNLELMGVSRSAAMAMVGHKTEAIYRRYAIVDAGALQDAAAKIDRATTDASVSKDAEVASA